MARKTTATALEDYQAQEVFLSALRDVGILRHAYDKAKISRAKIKRWLNDDPEFMRLYNEAVEESTERAEQIAYTHGVDGWIETETIEEYALIGDELKVVAKRVKKIKRYDSGLLKFVLSKRKPEYKERLDITTQDEKLGAGYEFIAAIVNDQERANAACDLISKLAGDS